MHSKHTHNITSTHPITLSTRNSRDSLLKLYQKQRAVDYLLDERLSETGTLRKAWVDVLDSIERGETIFGLGRVKQATATLLSCLLWSLIMSLVTYTSVVYGD
jgi:hypothetical protein